MKRAVTNMNMQRLLKTLAERLQADEYLHAYALIDPLLREPQWSLAPADTEVVPLGYSVLKEDQWPRLLRVRPADVELLAVSLREALDEQANPQQEAAKGLLIGGWLLSAKGIGAVALHLASVMRQLAPAGQGKKYLRWADRRVLEWAWPVLDDAQRSQLLGPITSWHVIDRTAELKCYQVKESGLRAALQLRPSQWRVVMECELVQEMLRGWQTFSNPLPEDYLEQAAHAVREVRCLGLDVPADMVLLGAYLLQVHPALCRHPVVRRSVERALAGEKPLVQILSEVPDPAGWIRIRHDCEQGWFAPSQAGTSICAVHDE